MLEDESNDKRKAMMKAM